MKQGQGQPYQQPYYVFAHCDHCGAAVLDGDEWEATNVILVHAECIETYINQERARQAKRFAAMKAQQNTPAAKVAKATQRNEPTPLTLVRPSADAPRPTVKTDDEK
jgi:hypothetical protein